MSFHPLRHAFAERVRRHAKDELKARGFALLAEHGFDARLTAAGPLSDDQVEDLFARAGDAVGDDVVVDLTPPEMSAAVGAIAPGGVLAAIVAWIKSAIAYLEAHPEVLVKILVGIMSILAMFGL